MEQYYVTILCNNTMVQYYGTILWRQMMGGASPPIIYHLPLPLALPLALALALPLSMPLPLDGNMGLDPVRPIYIIILMPATTR